MSCKRTRGEEFQQESTIQAITYEKENTMDENARFECGICYFQGMSREFTPITVSADFAALECPNCLNNDAASFEELQEEFKKAA
jgi:DNA-directed RNA polymerase subunit M/transcription elongation factor TFIIS